MTFGGGITIGTGIRIEPSAGVTTAGLVLHLDAGNTASYPGSGPTWTDLVASRIFTLTNGPTYNSSNGGHINFVAASSHYAECSSALTSLTTWTCEAWVSYVSTSGGANPAIVTDIQGGSKVNYVLGVPDGDRFAGATNGKVTGNTLIQGDAVNRGATGTGRGRRHRAIGHRRGTKQRGLQITAGAMRRSNRTHGEEGTGN